MKNEKQELLRKFFERDAKDVAIGLLGKTLCHRLPSGEIVRLRILETEAYTRKEDGNNCYGAEENHKSNLSQMFYSIGVLCDYWNMLIISCKSEEEPDNVLIRAAELTDKYGRTTYFDKPLNLRCEFWSEDKPTNSDLLSLNSESIWIEIADLNKPSYCCHKRIRLKYNTNRDAKLRFCLQED